MRVIFVVGTGGSFWGLGEGCQCDGRLQEIVFVGHHGGGIWCVTLVVIFGRYFGRCF